ncbi:DUF1133 family protein [Shigella flexneri]|uniref:DUF1133 family protein n=1 Tax=Shigella flexneri TaxID=623 RepID=UPI0033B35736
MHRFISEVLAIASRFLISVHRQRYEGRGIPNAEWLTLLNDAHPKWSLRTCEND